MEEIDTFGQELSVDGFVDESSNDGVVNGNTSENSNLSADNGSPSNSAKDMKENQQKEFDAEVEKRKYLRLTFLLEKTSLYSDFLSQKLTLAIDEKNAAQANQSQTTPTKPSNGKESEDAKKKRKRNKKEEVEEEPSDQPTKKGKSNEEEAVVTGTESPKTATFKQPALVTGGSLRLYQLRGVEWLISLYENGLNGILADEMGLGKTIQCISLLSHLIYHGVKGPFLIVGPLSTLANWVKEFTKWTPDIPVLMYHGTKDERTTLRATKLKCNSQVKGLQIGNMYPIVITSYEMIMNDRKYLGKMKWKYIIVDEGHRIKNLNCKLIRELRSYSSANRLLLTGTPLQNNLTELWSLLNFLLPDIFDDLESFQSWFDFSEIGEEGGQQVILEREQRNQVVTKLHHILRPFLLRRVKEDVEIDIPKKQEKVVHTSLTALQQKYYQAIVNKTFENVLSEQGLKQLKSRGTSLQNMLMHLRKTCNHPYLFEWPEDTNGNFVVNQDIINCSGKMQVLDRLLTRIRKEGNKVLVFSQMTRMLDILEDYMIYKQYRYARLDGSTAQVDRQASIENFSSDDDVFCFLLSTRAGGLGINLTAANVVIFFDNDWNPQVDLQAQDRCHRIGQTKPVKVYRLATANSVESRILERANNKLKLDRLVIQKGNFVGAKSESSITEKDLEELLNESPALAGHADEITDQQLFYWKDDSTNGKQE